MEIRYEKPLPKAEKLNIIRMESVPYGEIIYGDIGPNQKMLLLKIYRRIVDLKRPAENVWDLNVEINVRQRNVKAILTVELNDPPTMDDK